MRNGYNFFDGCGKISRTLCQQIAEVLDLKSTPSAVQSRLVTYGAGSDKDVDIFTCIFEQASYYALKVPDSVFMDMKNTQAEDLDRMLDTNTVPCRCIDEWVFHVD